MKRKEREEENINTAGRTRSLGIAGTESGSTMGLRSRHLQLGCFRAVGRSWEHGAGHVREKSPSVPGRAWPQTGPISPLSSCLMSLLACEVVNWLTMSSAVWL